LWEETGGRGTAAGTTSDRLVRVYGDLALADSPHRVEEHADLCRGGQGYRYYRLVTLADSAVVVGEVRF
jgi:hypothetical protein